MGLSAALQAADGKLTDQVHDPGNALHRLLPSHDDVSSPCLRYIDWYGDTVFNRLQMKDFLREWAGLRKRATTSEERALIDGITGLAERCRDEPHLYLRFIGD